MKSWKAIQVRKRSSLFRRSGKGRFPSTIKVTNYIEEIFSVTDRTSRTCRPKQATHSKRLTPWKLPLAEPPKENFPLESFHMIKLPPRFAEVQMQSEVSARLPTRTLTERLTVYEIHTPSGNWSSFSPHRHDTRENSPHHEETYYYRFSRRMDLPSSEFIPGIRTLTWQFQCSTEMSS